MSTPSTERTFRKRRGKGLRKMSSSYNKGQTARLREEMQSEMEKDSADRKSDSVRQSFVYTRAPRSSHSNNYRTSIHLTSPYNFSLHHHCIWSCFCFFSFSDPRGMHQGWFLVYGAPGSFFPPGFSVVLTQASQVAFARRKLKQATLNEPSCLCLLSVWHMKDMWLCETWRPYQAHAIQNDLA